MLYVALAFHFSAFLDHSLHTWRHVYMLEILKEQYLYRSFFNIYFETGSWA
jgi:hypothetical protein